MPWNPTSNVEFNRNTDPETQQVLQGDKHRILQPEFLIHYAEGKRACLRIKKICLTTFFFGRGQALSRPDFLPFRLQFSCIFNLSRTLYFFCTLFITAEVVLRFFRFGPRVLCANHSEIEVWGRGYSLGGGGDGVYRTDPRERAQERNCKAIIRLGYTNLPSWEVERIVPWMENTDWGADSYHPLARNCNCFCKQLARVLGLSVPSWVNRAARWVAPFFFMHGGCPPASITQSGLTTGKGVHGEPKSKARKSIYNK